MDQSSGQQGHPLANYQFSSDELRVLRDCNTESFFQRSLPLGIGFGVSAFFAVKHGYIRGNVKYGAVPKVIVGVVVGYFMGKFSYQRKCAEKLMRLPNSRLAEVLRQRKQDGVMGRLATDQSLVGMSLAPFSSNVTDVYSDEHTRGSGQGNALNLDADSRPTLAGLDDSYRPTLDTPSTFLEADLPLEAAKPGMSYEELRKRNREDYAKKQQNVFSRPLPPDAPAVVRQQTEAPTSKESAGGHHKGQTNKYGDTWTD